MTSRYAAYALALKLKCADVDAMLDGMSIMQFMEWQSFFRIREEERKKEKDQPGAATPGPPRSESGSGNAGLQARLLGAFSGYQKRQGKQNGPNKR